MQKELLPPNTIKEQMECWLAQLSIALNQKQKQLNLNKGIPQGHLRIAQLSQKTQKPQYYHYTNPKDKKGRFIPRKETKLAVQLAQKDYDISIIKLLKKQISQTRQYLKNINSISACYTKLHPARQQLITPVTLTDKQYAEQWQSVSWQGRLFAQDEHYLLTNRNEKVRSKSEVLIANALAKHGIPYRYEYPQTLKNSQNKMITFHPDFLCLNIKTRVEYIWEHFGLMDNPDYAQKAVRKLQFYAQNKIFPGRNLIITMETQTEPLTPQFVETMIKEYFYSSTR